VVIQKEGEITDRKLDYTGKGAYRGKARIQREGENAERSQEYRGKARIQR
jgi:hypothetical protein